MSTCFIYSSISLTKSLVNKISDWLSFIIMSILTAFPPPLCPSMSFLYDVRNVKQQLYAKRISLVNVVRLGGGGGEDAHQKTFSYMLNSRNRELVQCEKPFCGKFEG